MVSIHKLEIVVMHCNHASYACVVHEGIYVKEKKTFSYYSKTRLIPSSQDLYTCNVCCDSGQNVSPAS